MKNFKHKKLAIRSAFKNEQKRTQLPFLRFTLSVTDSERRGGTKNVTEGSGSKTDNIKTFLKTHLENKLFEPVIFPLYARCVFVNRLAATADF